MKIKIYSCRIYKDALLRARVHFSNCFVADNVWASADAVCDWLKSHDLKRLVIPYVPVGYVRDAIHVLQHELYKHGITVEFVMRSWDKDTWPHAGKGFFALKTKIPSILAAQGVMSCKV